EAERWLALAERLSGSVPEQRRWRLQVSLVLVRLALARTRNDLDAVAEQAQRLLALADSPEAIKTEVCEGTLRTAALIDLGVAGLWAGHVEPGDRHLEQGLEEARRIGQPWMELQAVSHLALLRHARFEAIAEQQAREAIELARARGWDETASAVATACVTLA